MNWRQPHEESRRARQATVLRRRSDLRDGLPQQAKRRTGEAAALIPDLELSLRIAQKENQISGKSLQATILHAWRAVR